jgi:hypothetical protein
MNECLATLPAMQLAGVQFLVPVRPMSRVEKVALLCNPASGVKFSSTANEIIKWVNFFYSCASKLTHFIISLAVLENLTPDAGLHKIATFSTLDIGIPRPTQTQAPIN